MRSKVDHEPQIFQFNNKMVVWSLHFPKFGQIVKIGQRRKNYQRILSHYMLQCRREFAQVFRISF